MAFPEQVSYVAGTTYYYAGKYWHNKLYFVHLRSRLLLFVYYFCYYYFNVYYFLHAAFETNNLGQISSNQPCLDGLKFSIDVESPAGQYNNNNNIIVSSL